MLIVTDILSLATSTVFLPRRKSRGNTEVTQRRLLRGASVLPRLFLRGKKKLIALVALLLSKKLMRYLIQLQNNTTGRSNTTVHFLTCNNQFN